MYLPNFEYVAPKTTAELAALLSAHGVKAKILSGGTDLIVAMKEKQMRPHYIIDISGLKSLQGIDYKEGKGLVIGAATKIEVIESDPLIKEKYHALHQAASAIGSPQVRAMASIGGNSCTASPAADTPPALVALGARVSLVSERGRREMPLEEFIQGNRITALAEDEFLESFILEEPWPDSSSSFQYVGLREAMEIDIANVAVNLAVDLKAGTVRDVRIVMGSVAPVPLRAQEAEKILIGQVLTDSLIEKAVDVCTQEANPIDDFRASAAYRREIVRVLVRRALQEARGRIE